MPTVLNYLFVDYLIMYSVDQTVYCQMIGWFMNNELEMIWKGVVIA
jgi:hypothetical protein